MTSDSAPESEIDMQELRDRIYGPSIFDEQILADRPLARDSWPTDLRGASGRDAFLAYIVRGWPLFFGADEEVETLLYHDLGHHVLRRGRWQITLTNLDAFPPDDAG